MGHRAMRSLQLSMRRAVHHANVGPSSGTETQFHLRVYKEQARRMRKQYLQQLEEEKETRLAKEAAVRAQVEESKALRLQAKEARKEKNRVAAARLREEISAEKAATRMAKRIRWEKNEALKSDARRQYVAQLSHLADSRITLDNLESRMDDAFFQESMPWKFPFIPFCNQDAPYWR